MSTFGRNRPIPHLLVSSLDRLQDSRRPRYQRTSEVSKGPCGPNEKGPPVEAGEPLVFWEICGPVRLRLKGGPARAALRREDRDGQVQQQRKAEAEQRQGDKGDARPQDVEAELVRNPGTHAEDHPIATILAKTLFHFFPFRPGARAGIMG